jgi:hypothetical protein
MTTIKKKYFTSRRKPEYDLDMRYRACDKTSIIALQAYKNNLFICCFRQRLHFWVFLRLILSAGLRINAWLLYHKFSEMQTRALSVPVLVISSPSTALLSPSCIYQLAAADPGRKCRGACNSTNNVTSYLPLSYINFKNYL